MFRFISSAALLVLVLSAVGCGEGLSDTVFLSHALAAPAHAAPDYGWQTKLSPTAVDGSVVDFY